jgi:hypothetical protein
MSLLTISGYCRENAPPTYPPEAKEIGKREERERKEIGKREEIEEEKYPWKIQ